jgi:hypothetical protein
MALEKQTNFLGINIPKAYYRINVIRQLNKQNGVALVTGYVDANEAEGFFQKDYLFSYDLAGDNPIRQAYKYLKTLPDFADAQDC